MSQTIQTPEQKSLWVLVSSLRDETKSTDLQSITSSVIELVNEWQSKGNFIWSGPFDDNRTGMAIFEATEKEARDFYAKYDKVCSGILNYHLYQWSAIPFLSAL
ncbi:MAG: hypothetical protein ACREAG_06225 [Nitrosopumilaceae archaeon]